MSIAILTLIGLAASSATYLFLSWRMHKKSTRLDDHLPLSIDNRQARVQSSNEFSAATVATTISLATVILAFAELAPYMGTWLLWTVVTTGLGIYVVRLAAPVIWRRLAESGQFRLTLHGFLGTSYQSSALGKGAALCTSFGFIGALAVELTVGGRFLAGLVPIIPGWAAVLVISAIGVTYTMLGGFRAVVVTDRIQMAAIWGSIAALAALFIWQLEVAGGPSYITRTMPKAIYDFSGRDGLVAFLVGIFIINVPTFLSDMSIWQRIAGSKDEATVRRGLTSSVLSATASWTALVALACFLVILVSAKDGENPLLTYLGRLDVAGNPVVAILFVVTVAGLYAASLSTASTQLIAAGHTLHMDLLRHGRQKAELSSSSSELRVSRIILLLSAGGSVLIVEVLQHAGFAISDLVFAVYGAQLGMVPAVTAALFMDKSRLRLLGPWATAAVLSGFVAGWTCAGLGKWMGSDNLVFLSPAASLAISSVILSMGWITSNVAARR
jgi:Na+/proline symporter